MFNKNPYLIPPSRFDVNGVEILLHHHDVFSGHYLAANGSASGLLNGDPCAMGNTLPRRQTVKKDRHSKIYTAQGPRDRRVRLSIGIARKFFDLQEMLGFDKPSKTLDWLLTKSKAAIKDLVQSKQKSADSPSECEILSSENGGDSKKKNAAGKDKGAPHQTSSSYLAKESRVKARARARERTKEKMCIKQLNGATYNINGCNSYNENGRFREDILHCPSLPPNEAADIIQESVMIKRKTKSPSFSGFQQNGVVSGSNYIIPSANSTDNWDVCNFNSQSNLYAILDHHKFINSNLNI